MINFREVFNTNYNIIFIIISITLLIILVLKKENLKNISKILIYVPIIIITINFIIQLIIKLIPNNIIKSFLLPIINNFNQNLLINNLIVLLSGITLLLTTKKDIDTLI
jgi:hypothetical protein